MKTKMFVAIASNILPNSWKRNCYHPFYDGFMVMNSVKGGVTFLLHTSLDFKMYLFFPPFLQKKRKCFVTEKMCVLPDYPKRLHLNITILVKRILWEAFRCWWTIYSCLLGNSGAVVANKAKDVYKPTSLNVDESQMWYQMFFHTLYHLCAKMLYFHT